MALLPTGTVTFLFTDIERSTQRLLRLGSVDYAMLQAEHQRLIRAACAAQGGVEVDTQGDAFFVAFPTAPGALAAAAQAQRALLANSPSWPDGQPLPVRMGLHTGTPLLVGDHYIGVDVVRAARIAACGHGGQVLLSQTVRDLAAPQLPEGATLRDLGAHRLKDLQESERLFQLVLSDLPAEFPPLKTLDHHAHNLPIQPTPLLGREEQVGAVSALLRRKDVRLVTLTGPGGIGKTRLAIQVAAELIEDFPDGVWLVRLSRLTDPGLVVPTIAQTLGLQDAGGQPIAERLRAYLRSRHTLLVLDNCEQVVVGVAGALAALREAAPRVTLLVTSRIPLHLRGEHVYPVPPLALAGAGPRTPERLAQSAAVALFVARAQEAQPAFTLTAANAVAIADICGQLDGLPLAIELAAARVRVLPPEALLARLSAQLKVLTGGARDAEERQQTMRATIAWSEALLAPAEQVLFRRLAVFVGGCSLEAAEAVCAAPAGTEPLQVDMLEGLSTLVDHNLIQQRETGGEPRFGLPQVVREYALERLTASEDAETVRQAHAAYFLTLAEEAEPWLLGGLRLPETLIRLEREHYNLRAALGWTQRQGKVTLGLRLAGAVARFWVLCGHLSEGREWLEALLALAAGGQVNKRMEHPLSDEAEATVSDRVRAKALFGAGELATYQDDNHRAQALLEQSLALARQAGDDVLTVLVLNRLGFAAQVQDDLGRATDWYEASLNLARPLDNPALIEMPLSNLGFVAYLQGDLQRAEANSAAALALIRQAQDWLWLPYELGLMAAIRLRQGNLPQSFQLLGEAFTVLQDSLTRGWPLLSVTPWQLVRLARVLAVAGRGEQAARLLGAGEAFLETSGMSRVAGVSNQVDTEAAVAPARAALGEEAWAAAFAAGQAMTLEEAIAEALSDVDDVDRSST